MSYDYSKNKCEHPETIKANIQGVVPEWLQGILVRNGPGLFSVGDTSYNHWFDGMALMHSFTFKNGEVTYRSKYLRGDTYNSNMQANRIVVSEMGTMAYPHPSENIFTKVITFVNHTIPDFTDNCVGNIIKYGIDYFVTSETNYIRKIDPVTLETQDKVDYRKYLSVNLVISHPHYDKEGNTYNIGTSIANKGQSKYVLFKVPAVARSQADSKWSPALKDVEVLCTLPCHSVFTPSYYHSFGLTENYVVFVEQPLKLDILRMATAYLRRVSWATCLKYQPEEQVLIHLINRKTKKEVSLKYYTDAMVVYHHVNAYEEEGHVICDVVAYENNSLFDMFYLDKLKEQSVSVSTSNVPRYKRFVLPLNDEKHKIGDNLVNLKYTSASAIKEKEGKLQCQPEVLSEGTELPRINYNYNGQKHRYVYMNFSKFALATKLVKLDVETKLQTEWSLDNCWPTEPVFVPRPGASEEDDGVVLASVINSNPGESDFLLVLDGKSLRELARVSVNVELHVDMHGFFIPDTSDETHLECSSL